MQAPWEEGDGEGQFCLCSLPHFPGATAAVCVHLFALSHGHDGHLGDNCFGDLKRRSSWAFFRFSWSGFYVKLIVEIETGTLQCARTVLKVRYMIRTRTRVFMVARMYFWKYTKDVISGDVLIYLAIRAQSRRPLAISLMNTNRVTRHPVQRRANGKSSMVSDNASSSTSSIETPENKGHEIPLNVNLSFILQSLWIWSGVGSLKLSDMCALPKPASKWTIRNLFSFS